MLTDTQIIELYWQRDELAITESREKYGKYCNKVAYSILGNPEDAEECEHDTYLTAWNTIPPERPVLLRAYLAKITRNLSVSLLRGRSAQKPARPPPTPPYRTSSHDRKGRSCG